MSVLIRGMEMPSSCDNCPFCGCYVRDDGTEENYRCCVTMRVLTEFDIVEEHCPLATVPPHGDLIDRKALLADTTDMIHSMMVFGGARVYTSDAIKNAHTVIPAEE